MISFFIFFFPKESVTMQEGQEKNNLRNEIERITARMSWMHISDMNAGKGLFSSGETDEKFPSWEYVRWQQIQKKSYQFDKLSIFTDSLFRQGALMGFVCGREMLYLQSVHKIIKFPCLANLCSSKPKER